MSDDMIASPDGKQGSAERVFSSLHYVKIQATALRG